jgi:hypothetical protein
MSLQRSIGNGAVTRMLQRAPTSRDTERPTTFGDRITGKPAEKLRKFADLRAGAADDAAAIVNDLGWDHLWGGSKSNVTRTGNRYSIRIDRQNPTPTHSNVQIQTNGTSISLATVLIADTLNEAAAEAAATSRNAIMTLVRAAFLSSLGDGMQWEVYDDAPAPEKPKPEVKEKGTGKGGGKGKWNDTRKDRGGAGGGGNPLVGVQ